MTTESATLFFGLLTFLSMGIGLAALAPWVVRSWRPVIWDTVEPLRLPVAAAVAGTCMLGSLYFSEVANFTPCTLCWYQRVLMYPSAILLVLAAVRRDLDQRRYVLVLAGLGMLVSSYHILVERFPSTFESSKVCELGVPCSRIWFERFGFITLPVMALVGFTTVVALLTIPAPEINEDNPV